MQKDLPRRLSVQDQATAFTNESLRGIVATMTSTPSPLFGKEPIVSDGAYGNALTQLDHFFEHSMRDLQRKEC